MTIHDVGQFLFDGIGFLFDVFPGESKFVVYTVIGTIIYQYIYGGHFPAKRSKAQCEEDN